jgi:hypothetical protein
MEPSSACAARTSRRAREACRREPTSNQRGAKATLRGDASNQKHLQPGTTLGRPERPGADWPSFLVPLAGGAEPAARIPSFLSERDAARLEGRRHVLDRRSARGGHLARLTARTRCKDPNRLCRSLGSLGLTLGAARVAVGLPGSSADHVAGASRDRSDHQHERRQRCCPAAPTLGSKTRERHSRLIMGPKLAGANPP